MRSKAESALQRQCVQWFNYAKHGCILFAVPNGGSRHKIEAANLKREGVLAGVSDLILITPLATVFIELKAPTTYKVGKRGNMVIDKKGGDQSNHQKEFQESIGKMGLDYHLVDNFDDFIKIANKYT